MKKKAIIFFIIFAIIFNYTSYLLQPSWKYVPNISEGETDKYLSFYDLPSNNLDYLTLGVSHSFFSINPMQIYAETGIIGYNLGSPSQSISTSYYWLKEACKYQKPSLVFLDISSLLYSDAMVDAASETKALLYMRLSPNKINALINCKATNQKLLYFVFPLLQFHDRWKELSRNDWHKTSEEYFLNGAYLGFTTSRVTDKNELNLDQGTYFWQESDDILQSNSIPSVSLSNKEYFEKIIAFCNTNSINLIPIKAPTLNWSLQKKQILSDFLKPYQLTLWDLNDETSLLLDWNIDTADNGYHTNYWGATKTSHIIAEFLKNQNLVSDNKKYWIKRMREYTTWEINMLNNDKFRSLDYLQKLAMHKENLCIIISVQDDAAVGWNNHLEACIKELGLEENFYPNIQNSYIAIIDEGEVLFEKWAEAPIVLNMLVNDVYNISVFSGGFSYGSKSSILINGQEYSLNNRGLNIVAIDTKSGEIVSSASIDTHDPAQWFNEKEVFSAQTSVWNDYYMQSQKVPDGIYTLSPYIDPNFNIEVNHMGEINICPREDTVNQLFELKNIGAGLITLRAVGSGKYIKPDNASNIPGAEVVFDEFTDLAMEKWFVAKNTNGSYSLLSLYNGLALDISRENSGSGINLRCQIDSGDESQQLILRSVQ